MKQGMTGISSWSLLALLGLSLMPGCGSSPVPCVPGVDNGGRFCYQGIDFGRADDPLYRQGIKDGCSTGKGYFRKDYSLSGTSPLYRAGWDKGRTLCRPEGWSDSPTYSYHPIPSSAQRSDTGEEEYVSTEERIRRYSTE